MPIDPQCPACSAKRIHSDEEWKLHPGEGRQGKEWDIPIKTEPEKPKGNS